MSDLFVSYARADEALARRVRDALKLEGYKSVFLDIDPEDGITPFADWKSVLYRKLRGCRAVIALCTDRSLASKWCFAELSIASALEHAVLPVVGPAFSGDLLRLPGALPQLQAVVADADDDALAAALARGLRGLGVAPNPWGPWNPDLSPYPGLESHDASRAAVFFGREAEVQQGLQMLRGARSAGSGRFIAIVGSSGTGKSSLMLAGILPRLRIATAEPWEVVLLQQFRPGRAPVPDLASALARSFGGSWATYRDRIVADGAINPLIQDLLRDRPESTRVLIALDQFEQWLGGEPDSDALLALLRSALDADPHIVVLVTMRADFLGSLQAHPQLRGLEKRQLSIEPIGSAALRRAVVEPARVAEVEIEDGLVKQILDDAAQGPGLLPLVAFTLELLWELGVSPSHRRLELSMYTRLGGIGGAIRNRVAECLPADIAAAELAALRDKFQALVDVDEAGRFRRRRAVWNDDEPAGRLLERLRQGRLLTVHRVDGQRVLEVAHEALFEEWELLRRWLHEDRETLRFRAELVQAADVWARDGQAAADLWRGGRLQRAEELHQGARLALEGASLRFLAASLGERARERAVEQARQQERVRMGAISQARWLATQARDALAKHPQRALALAVEAVYATTRESLPPCAAAESALHALVEQVTGRPLRAPSRAAVNALVPSPDGRHLACAQDDGSVSVWALNGGTPTGASRLLGAHRAAANAALWLGEQLYTAGQDAELVCWHPAEPGRTPERVSGAAAIHHLAVDPRGRWVVAGSGDELIVWSPRSGAHARLRGHTDRVRALAFHPEGSFLLSSDFKGALLAWPAAEDSIAGKFTAWQSPDGNRIDAIAFDAAGRFFVTAGLQGVQLWRMSVGDDGRMAIRVQALDGMPDYAVRVAVSPAGEVIAAQTYEGRCAAWLQDDDFRVPVDLGAGLRLPLDPFGDRGFGLLTVGRSEPRIDYRALGQLRDGLLPLALRGDDSVRPVSFLPNGWIAAGDDAGVLRCWAAEAQHPQRVWAPDPGLDLNRVAISADACVVLTAGERVVRGRELDRRARRVDLDAGQVEILEPFDAGVDAVDLSADGKVLALGSDRVGQIVLIDRARATRRLLPVEDGVSCVTISADARLLAAGVGDSVLVWDLSRDAPYPPIATEASVIALAFDRRAERLAVSVAGGVLGLWDLRHEAPAAIAQRKFGGLIGELLWSADAALLVASGLTRWHAQAVVCRPDRSPVEWAELDLGPAANAMTRTAVDLSADGARLVAAGDGSHVARVFDLNDPGHPIRDLHGHDQRIRDVAITPDGRRIATSSEDATLRLWEIDQPDAVVLSVVNGSAGRVAFRGRRLLAVAEAGVHRWNLDLDALIAQAGATASRNLSADESNRFLFGASRPTFPESLA